MKCSPYVLTAVDLGSNSFRFIVARFTENHPRLQYTVVETGREPARLAVGLSADKHLDKAACQRGLAILNRFGQRLKNIESNTIRAVATSAIRVARNADDFLCEAELALGCPIEIISEREEANLIYLGASYEARSCHGNRLVIDIGGNSTELVIGNNHRSTLLESLYLGCISHSLQFFPQGKIDAYTMQAAEAAVQAKVAPLRDAYHQLGWSQVIGSSGTARALAEILEQNGLNKNHSRINKMPSSISRAGLERLRSILINAKNINALNLYALDDERRTLLPGGLAIMLGILTELEIEKIDLVNDALRIGILYDLREKKYMPSQTTQSLPLYAAI